MKIDNDPKTNILDSLVRPNQVKSAKDAGTEAKVSGDTTDKVELSSRQEEIARLTERVKAAPDVRQEKIDQVQKAIESETYNVKGQLVARSILKSQFMDQVL
jgi:flagellar biosynthesis anti-sigma factor FlgM